jgi:hypothetical protein
MFIRMSNISLFVLLARAQTRELYGSICTREYNVQLQTDGFHAPGDQRNIHSPESSILASAHSPQQGLDAYTIWD